jgi:WhiB family redox-sensing transcriptional regulator
MPGLVVAAQWEWQLHAACRGCDTDTFFPTTASGWGARQSRPPRHIQRLCDSCPVRIDCLNHALTWNEEGIWGGTTTAQRAAIRRTVRRVRCPGCDSNRLLATAAAAQVCGDCGMSWRATTVRGPSRAHRPNLGLRPRRRVA